MTRLAILPPWTPATIALLGTMPDPALAEHVGCSTYAVKAERKRRRIAPYDGGGRRPRGDVAATERRTVKLTPDEAALTDAAAGEQPWATWAHDRLVEAAQRTKTTT